MNLLRKYNKIVITLSLKSKLFSSLKRVNWKSVDKQNEKITKKIT